MRQSDSLLENSLDVAFKHGSGSWHTSRHVASSVLFAVLGSDKETQQQKQQQVKRNNARKTGSTT